MYQDNQKTQYNECLICLSPILSDISFVQLVTPMPICEHCLSQFEIIDKTLDFHHYPLRILYSYNEFFRSLLFQYKGLYDYALKDVFLALFHNELAQKYHDYLVVTAPSWHEDNKARGFAPIQSIANTFSLHVFTGLFKKEKYKQSNLSYSERKNVESKLGIRNGEELRGKKVLILDDVMTSGSTLKACLDLILVFKPITVELLVLSSGMNELKT